MESRPCTSPNKKHMEVAQKKKACLNILPHGYPSWLKFYDRIPDQHKSAAQIIARIIDESGEQVYVIEQEFMLARLAEELLPTRITHAQFNTLRLHLREADKHSEVFSFAEGMQWLSRIGAASIWPIMKRSAVN